MNKEITAVIYQVAYTINLISMDNLKGLLTIFAFLSIH